MNINQVYRIEERVNMAAPQDPTAPVVYRKPLLKIWKKARSVDFDDVGNPLNTQWWFKTTETIMESMELFDN